jgi:hypothetical protein
MDKPLILIGYLGFPVQNLTRANTLVSNEVGAMAKIFNKWGFSAAVAKTEIETPKILYEKTGINIWDGVTQPFALALHQALPNIPGGIKAEHDRMLNIIAQVLPEVKQMYRLVIDNNKSMSHHALMSSLKRKSEKCHYFKGYKLSPGKNIGYGSLHKYINYHIQNNSFYEIGYESAREPTLSPAQFKPFEMFSEQLLLTSSSFAIEPKTLDFCYVGNSRANDKKKNRRLGALSEFLAHENSFYGGSLFKKRSSILFPKAWAMMSASKAHLIVRDEGMAQLPLHRYLQALVHKAIPVVLNEPSPVDFIYSPVLQKELRVNSYEQALELVGRYEELLPLLEKELQYWIEYDRIRSISAQS